jgi:chromosome segregation ATPase
LSDAADELLAAQIKQHDEEIHSLRTRSHETINRILEHEGQIAVLKHQQAETKDDFTELKLKMDAGFDKLNEKSDKLGRTAWMVFAALVPTLITLVYSIAQH